MPKKYDVVAITGEYEKQGQKKIKYQNAGLIIEKDGKHYLKLNTPIVMHEDGHVVTFFSLFEPQQRSNQADENQGGGGGSTEAPDDDIPFITRHGMY